MALPTQREISRAIHSAHTRPDEISDVEVLTLTKVVHASYDDNLANPFAELSDEYSDRSNGNDLQQDLALALTRLTNGAADWLVPDLIRYFDSDPQFYELAHAILALSFPKTNTQVDKSFVQGRMQREVLASLANHTKIWECDLDFANELSNRGLPNNRKAIINLLAATENIR